MTEDDGDTAVKPPAAVFPVILYDGEREMNVGNMKIVSDLTFKQFQLNLSQMIGISYNNITSYLVDNKNHYSAVNSTDRRKILITGKFNFAVICRQVNCYFLVVLKRSRRDRRRKVFPADDLSRVPYSHMLNFNDAQTTSLSPFHYNNNININNNNNSYYYNDDDRYSDRYINDMDYVNMMMMNLNMNMNFPAIEEVYGRRNNRPNVRVLDRSLCKECKAMDNQLRMKGEFHCCVYDEVVVGFFRSPAGPIARPVKMKKTEGSGKCM